MANVQYWYDPVKDMYCRRTQKNVQVTARRSDYIWKPFSALLKRHQPKLAMLNMGDVKLSIRGVGFRRPSALKKPYILITLDNEAWTKNYEHTPESEG